MIVGLGSDLVEVRQVRRELARGSWNAGDGVFTSAEIAWCGPGRRPERRFAACFAAKEAALKALGAELENVGTLREVEVNFGSGPGGQIILHDHLEAIARRLGGRHIKLSVAVGRKSAAAMVILES